MTYAYFGMPGPIELLLGIGFLVLFTLWWVGREAEKRDLAAGRPLYQRRLAKATAPQAARKVEPRPAPDWFLPAGIVAVTLGILGFLASAAVGGGGSAPGSLAAGLSNPLFFIGVPLGVYWLRRHANQPGKPRAVSSSSETETRPERGNPKLTHCPDCGGHVSRLAITCPHCGRPLAAEPEGERPMNSREEAQNQEGQGDSRPSTSRTARAPQ